MRFCSGLSILRLVYTVAEDKRVGLGYGNMCPTTSAHKRLQLHCTSCSTIYPPCCVQVYLITTRIIMRVGTTPLMYGIFIPLQHLTRTCCTFAPKYLIACWVQGRGRLRWWVATRSSIRSWRLHWLS